MPIRLAILTGGATLTFLVATALVINAQQPGSPKGSSGSETPLFLPVPVLPPGTNGLVLHNFACPPKGAYPSSGVIRDSAGNFYGTASSGGAADAGVVYEVNAAGHQTVLYSFTGGTDGAYPWAGVTRDSSGNLYGTTGQGGAFGQGVVYKLDAAGHQTVLYSFTGGTDGGYPSAGVILDQDGNLYGTTNVGGTAWSGVVYKLDSAGHETVLHSFSGPDGANPSGGVVRDSAGNLYGTTYAGGTAPPYAGVIFKLDTLGHATILYGFTGGPDGGYPDAGVTLDSAGNLYGTTEQGGTQGFGVVYKLNGSGQETVLHSFTGGADGATPYAGVVLDSTGNLYGTAEQGGSANMGVIFRVNRAAQQTVLYNFTGGVAGGYPTAGVTLDSANNLYGTTASGGTAGLGMAYKVDRSGHESVMYSFVSATDGGRPGGGLIRDASGNLYGTTSGGGAANAGVIYKLNVAGQEKILYSFTGADGSPSAGVIRDSAGNLYGTTSNGGAANRGVVFKLDASGLESVLYTFSGGADGSSPNAGVVQDAGGNLYGTTVGGGTFGHGVVYKLDTTGRETVLHNFTGGPDGGSPYSGVILDSKGNLYGTAVSGGNSFNGCSWGCGVVYMLDTTGNQTVLYNFTGSAGGANPYTSLIRDVSGNLYGTTRVGGMANAGVVFKLSASGLETVLCVFTGGTYGGYPSGITLDSVGNIYGTTSGGGTANAGVVYKLDKRTGQESILYSFTGGADGREPSAGVIRDSAGNLYGTTDMGGKATTGVVFKVKPS